MIISNPLNSFKNNYKKVKSIKFLTLGCKVNQYETQALRESCLYSGFKESFNNKKADIYVINSCTVTHRADAESLGLIRRCNRENPKARIIVTGCLTQLDSDKIRNIGPSVCVVKNKDKDNIPLFLNEHRVNHGVRRSYRKPNEHNEFGISRFSGHIRAFLKIQDGCNNHCSYCKIPFVRGGSKSRPFKDIFQEALNLTNNGYQEIVLTGICLGAYGKDKPKKDSFLFLLKELEKIERLKRIRLSSIELNDINDGLIAFMSKSSKFCNHLHIPLQSGDDEILKKMNRSYSVGDFIKRISSIKRNIPDISITTDVLVGFPQENEKNFTNTVETLKVLKPLKIHVFPYSRREYTSASKFANQVDVKTIKNRVKVLLDLSDKLSFEFRQRFLNKKEEVLIEAKNKKNTAFWQGYLRNYIKIEIKSSKILRNKFISVLLMNFSKDRQTIIGNLS